MKKRWTALLLALAMLSALAVGALADEQKKDETAAETAQTTPDAEGTLSSRSRRMSPRSSAWTMTRCTRTCATASTVSPPPSGV